MSHVPIALLFLGALFPLYVAAGMWDRKKTDTRLRRSRLHVHLQRPLDSTSMTRRFGASSLYNGLVAGLAAGSRDALTAIRFASQACTSSSIQPTE
jgi:hypothetical protein